MKWLAAIALCWIVIGGAASAQFNRCRAGFCNPPASGPALPLDGLSPTAAYSPSRKLRSAYGGAFTAGGAQVTTLFDQSGAGRNLTNTGGITRPFISGLGLNFDGSANFLTSAAATSAFFSAGSGYIIMTANIQSTTNDPTPANNAPLFESSTKEFGLTASDDGSGSTYALAINGADTQYGFAPFTFPIVIECRHEGGEFFIRINGGFEFPIPTSDTVLTGVMNMGGRAGGPWVNAIIYETATFSTVPDQATRDALVQAFGSYVGIF